MAKRIFINYRKALHKNESRLIQKTLEKSFRVFRDESGLEAGKHWLHELERQVDASAAMISLIGHGWADVVDQSGARRIDNPNDFVRFEIARAFMRGIPVIPLLLDGAAMPATQNLPPNLQPLTFQQAAIWRGESLDEDGDKIAEILKARIAEQRRKGVSSSSVAVFAAGSLLAGAALWPILWKTADVFPPWVEQGDAEVLKRAQDAESRMQQNQESLVDARQARTAAEKRTQELIQKLSEENARYESLKLEIDRYKRRIFSNAKSLAAFYVTRKHDEQQSQNNRVRLTIRNKRHYETVKNILYEKYEISSKTENLQRQVEVRKKQVCRLKLDLNKLAQSQEEILSCTVRNLNGNRVLKTYQLPKNYEGNASFIDDKNTIRAVSTDRYVMTFSIDGFASAKVERLEENLSSVTKGNFILNYTDGYEIIDLKKRRVVKDFTQYGTNAFYSPNENKIISNDDTYIYVIDARNYSLIWKQPYTKVLNIHISKNEKYMLAATQNAIKFINSENGNLVYENKDYNLYNIMHISTDGENIVLRQNYKIYHLNLKNGYFTDLGFSVEDVSVKTTADNLFLITTDKSGSINIQSIESGSYEENIGNYESSVKSLSISTGGEILLSAHADGSIKLWDISEWTAR